MSNILITGGAGYLGTSLTHRLVTRDHNVTVYDSFMYGQEGAISNLAYMLQNDISIVDIFLNNPALTQPSDFRVINGDVRDQEKLKDLFSENKFDYTFHLAGLIGHFCCEKNPKLAREVDVAATKNIVDLCIQHETKLLYNSSSSIYGTRDNPGLLKETDAPGENLDVYCQNKLDCEEYILRKKEENPDFQFVIFRPATVGGLSPRMRLGLLPNHFTYAVQTQRRLSLAGPNNHRAIIDINDLIDSYTEVIESHEPLEGIFNIGNHNETKQDYLKQIARMLNNDVQINAIGGIEGERNLRISSEKFIEKFEFTPYRSFLDTVTPLLFLLEEQPDLFERNNFRGVLNMSLGEWRTLLS